MVGSWVGGWEGYTGTPTQPSQGPYIHIYKAEGPTHGQMKGKSEVLMRFLRLGLEWVPELTQNDPRIDPPDDPPDWSRDDPQMTISRTSDIQWSRIGSF